MDNDDQPVGRVLSRREALRLLGLASASLVAGCGMASTTTGQPTAGTNTEAATSLAVADTAGPSAATAVATAEAATAVAAAGDAPACIVSPALTEGPYFVDEQLNRSDIRSDPASGAVVEGLPLALAFKVWQVGEASCAPLAGALVDVWHCDAQGVYSDVTDSAQGFNTVGQQFLRGQQQTGADGLASFTTIYPGWYSGRAVHIHFKVRTAAAAEQTYEFTSQLFFDDALTDEVHTQPPYASKGQRDMRNSADGIYQQGGEQLVLALAKSGQGYAATFNIGVDLSETSTQQDGGPGGRPAGPPPRATAALGS